MREPFDLKGRRHVNLLHVMQHHLLEAEQLKVVDHEG